MAWDEWEQVKAQVAERHTARLQLNGLPGEGGRADPSGGGGGGGAGTLRHKGGPWTKAAGTADGLQTSTITAKVDLRKAHDCISSGLAGLSSLGSLKSVLTSWDERLGRLREECSSLEPKLRQVAVDFAEVDAEVAERTKAVVVPGTRRGE
ncbi:amino acid ABC transporter permease [Streptomyces sp. WC2508]|uniref:amino acid ABC transporter permease n=1 Tax=Streptomyces sp. WC2508 TaxID=3461405 RepID=UPI004043ABB0